MGWEENKECLWSCLVPGRPDDETFLEEDKTLSEALGPFPLMTLLEVTALLSVAKLSRSEKTAPTEMRK